MIYTFFILTSVERYINADGKWVKLTLAMLHDDNGGASSYSAASNS